MKPSYAVRRLFAVLTLLTAAGACTPGWGRPQNPFDTSDGAPGEIRVAVDNQNFNDATIVALRGGERVRLGDVVGKSRSNFDVRWDFTLAIEFEVALIGGGGCVTRPLNVSAGDQIWLRVPVNIGATPCQAGK